MAKTIFPPYRHIILASCGSKHKYMMISSPAFAEGGAIPERYGCTGEALSPPLQIDQVPADALYLALIMDDPDAPGGTYDHWINWNIPLTELIAAGSHPGISGSNARTKPGTMPHALLPAHTAIISGSTRWTTIWISPQDQAAKNWNRR